MKTTFVGKRQEQTAEFISSTEKKLGKFDRFFEDATAQIKTDKKRDGESVELTIFSGGRIYRSEKKADTVQNALDQTVEAILRQIRKNKTRLEKNLKAGAFKPVAEEPVVEDEELPTFRVRTKTFPVKPMSVEDAVLQMLLLEHDFFLFRNVETGNLNVVYKRADGDYGLIIPD